MKKLLVICGASGSGKSHLEDGLAFFYPNTFKPLKQYTTRPRRPDDELESYVFVTKQEVELFHRDPEVKIIGETEINGNLYGTFLESFPDHISTIVLNRMGIDNIINHPHLRDYRVRILRVKAGEDIELAPREGRPAEFIQQEEESLDPVADLTLVRHIEGFDYEEILCQIQDLFDQERGYYDVQSLAKD